MEVDYSSTVEEKIPQAKELAAQNKLEDALEMLLALEKQTRTGADMHSTSKVLVAIVQICFEVRVKFQLPIFSMQYQKYFGLAML